MKKKTLLLMAMIATSLAFSQEKVTINVAQDIRLATFGGHVDGKKKIDITIRAELQGNRQSYGYIFFAPEFEYAKLTREYKRYSINFGATFLWLHKVPLTASIGYGITDHQGAYTSFNGNIQIGYKMGKLTPFVDLQVVDRKDILRYGERIRLSGFLGVKYEIN